jgi:hypothetical protein
VTRGLGALAALAPALPRESSSAAVTAGGNYRTGPRLPGHACGKF